MWAVHVCTFQGEGLKDVYEQLHAIHGRTAVEY